MQANVNSNELIKMLGMIFFTYEKHLKEKFNNSKTILEAGTRQRNYCSHTPGNCFLTNAYEQLAVLRASDIEVQRRSDNFHKIMGTSAENKYSFLGRRRKRTQETLPHLVHTFFRRFTRHGMQLHGNLT